LQIFLGGIFGASCIILGYHFDYLGENKEWMMYRVSFFIRSLQGFSHRAKYDGHFEGLSGV
jgi:hypothetical protein